MAHQQHLGYYFFLKYEYEGLKCTMCAVSEDIYRDCNVLASHALCFMVCGNHTNWKQVVAWYPTGHSTAGLKQWEIAEKIVELLYDSSLTQSLHHKTQKMYDENMN